MDKKYKERIRYREKRRIKKHKFIRDIELWSPILEKYLNEFFSCCVMCYSEKDLTVDHLIPLFPEDGTKGFPLQPGNALILCRKCNSKKRNKILTDLPNHLSHKLIFAAKSFKINAIIEGLVKKDFELVQGSWDDIYTPRINKPYKYHWLTDKKIREIYNRLKNGESARKIGTEEGIDSRTIYTIARCESVRYKNLGLEPLTPPYSNRYKFSKKGKRLRKKPIDRKYKIPNEVVVRAYNRVAEGKQSLPDIAREESISESYLKTICRRQAQRAITLNLTPIVWDNMGYGFWNEEEDRILEEHVRTSTNRRGIENLLPYRTLSSIVKRINVLERRKARNGMNRS